MDASQGKTHSGCLLSCLPGANCCKPYGPPPSFLECLENACFEAIASKSFTIVLFFFWNSNLTQIVDKNEVYIVVFWLCSLPSKQVFVKSYKWLAMQDCECYYLLMLGEKWRRLGFFFMELSFYLDFQPYLSIGLGTPRINVYLSFCN